MRSPVSPLNHALYDRLDAATPTPVYDYVPVGKTPPYIVLTDTDSSEWITKTVSGADVLATVKVISVYLGDKEVAELADTVISAVTGSTLTLTLTDDWSVALVSLVSHSVARLETHREATLQFKFTIVDTRSDHNVLDS